jgi:hypothetical protein
MNTKRIVLEWAEINGKRVPKRVIDIVPKERVPKSIKNNGKLIDEIFMETKVDNIGDQLTAGFELILARLDSIDKRISNLKGNAKGNLGAVEVAVNDGFKKVIEELKKINHATSKLGIGVE